jgi:hypothetical protein
MNMNKQWSLVFVFCFSCAGIPEGRYELQGDASIEETRQFHQQLLKTDFQSEGFQRLYQYFFEDFTREVKASPFRLDVESKKVTLVRGEQSFPLEGLKREYQLTFSRPLLLPLVSVEITHQLQFQASGKPSWTLTPDLDLAKARISQARARTDLKSLAPLSKKLSDIVEGLDVPQPQVSLHIIDVAIKGLAVEIYGR